MNKKTGGKMKNSNFIFTLKILIISLMVICIPAIQVIAAENVS
jgi:hypothetical protein